jgi:hypothetical protein
VRRFLIGLYAILLVSLQAPAGDFRVSEENYEEVFFEQFPSVGSDSIGRFVAIWMDERQGQYAIYGQRYDQNGIPIGGNFSVSQYSSDECSESSISMNAEGRFSVTWVQGEQVYARLFDPYGSPVTPPMLVNDDVGNKHSCSSVVMLDDGSFVVTWQDWRNVTWAPDIFAQLFNRDGSPFWINFVVNDHVGGEQGFPDVSASSSDSYTIVWMDSRDGDFDIFAQSFFGTTPMWTNRKVNDDAGNERQCQPSFTGGLLVWEDYREGFPNIYASRMSYSSPVDSNFKVNDDTDTVRHANPSIGNMGINYLIVWEDGRNGATDVYAQVVDKYGNCIGTNFQVDDAADTIPTQFAEVGGGEGGGVVVFQCQKEHESDIHFQRYDSSGFPQDSNIAVTGNYYGAHQLFPCISSEWNGVCTVVWEDMRKGNADVYAQIVDTAGTNIGSNLSLIDDTGLSEQMLPSAAKDTVGDVAVTWMDAREGKWDIYAVLLDESGNPLSSNFRVNVDTSINDQFFPACAKNIKGGFIITWCDRGLVLGRRYDNAGNALGLPFRMNEDTISGSYPSVVYSYDCGFIVTYLAGAKRILVRLFDSTAAPVGSSLRVDDDSTGALKFAPLIGIDASCHYTVVWEDMRNMEPDIYAQRLDSVGNQIGENMRVNDDSWGNEQYLPAVTVSPQGKCTITWMDDREQRLDIYAQRYDDGLPWGGNFRVNDCAGLCPMASPDVSMNETGQIFFVWEDTRSGCTGSDIYAKVMRFESGVEEREYNRTRAKASLQMEPNPCMGKTEISLVLPYPDKNAHIKLFDASGRLLSVIKEAGLPKGINRYTWKAVDDNGKSLPSGIYFIVFRSKSLCISKKLVLLR